MSCFFSGTSLATSSASATFATSTNNNFNNIKFVPECKNSVDENTEPPLECEAVVKVHVCADHHGEDGLEQVEDQNKAKHVTDQTLVVLDQPG